MTAHPGSYCSPAGGVDVTKAGTEMVCNVTKPGERARWRRNGPAPARAPRRRRGAAAGSPLPVVDAGIRVPAPAPEPAPQPAPEPAPQPAPADLGARIRAVYQRLAPRPGTYIPLTQLRAELADVPRAELDAALVKLLDSPDARLEPEPFNHRIGPAERAAAVYIGGEDRHKLVFG